MEFSIKNILKFLLFLGLGLFLLAWAFKNMDLQKMFNEIKQANFFWILIAMICGILSHAARALRWNLLLKPLGYTANNWNAFYAVMIGYFSNNLVPRLGEVTRCAALAKTDRIPIEKLIGTVITERIVDLILTALITLFIFISQFELLTGFYTDVISPMLGNSKNESNFKYILLAGIIIICLLVYIFRNKIKSLTIFKKVSTLLNGFVEGVKSILKLEKPLLFILYSLFIWSMYFAMAYFTFFAYPPTSQFGLEEGLLVLFLGTVAIILPIPGGIGVYHKLVGLGLVLYGVTESEGLTYATLSHATQMIMIFIVGLISMVLISLKLRKRLTVDDIL